MPITIGSNIYSLRAQRMLAESTAVFSRSSERLSSGLRINRASDDAAGLAVVSTLTARARVLGRAKLNIQDGQSLLDIADGSLGSVSDVLQRMSELAAQAANGSLGLQQRRSLDDEYRQLSAEIRRIAATTKMNGLSPLARRAGGATATAIYNVDQQNFPTLLGASGDGRYALHTTDSLGNGYLRLYDNQTGTAQQIFAQPVTRAKISADGMVLFISGNNLFTYDPKTSTTNQLTNAAVAIGNISIAISGNSNTIAFHSNAQFAVGESIGKSLSGTGAYQLYTADLTTGKITSAVSGVPAGVSNLSLSADGTQLAVGYSAVSGLLRMSVGSSSLTTVLAGGNYGANQFAISNNGTVTFITNANVAGLNPGGTRQLFTYDAANNFSKLTTAPTGLGQTFSLSTDESSIYFTSSSDLMGDGGGNGFRLFSLDTGTQTLGQIAKPGELTGWILGTPIMVSGNGSKVYFQPDGQATPGLTLLDYSNQSSNFNFSVGNGSQGGIEVAIGAVVTSLSALGGFTLSSARGAQAALESINGSIASLSLVRSVIGAGQSRLQAAGSLVQSQEVEVSAAAGRISDADIAAETATTVRARILQDVGAAILAQANQQPSIALSLLSFQTGDR